MTTVSVNDDDGDDDSPNPVRDWIESSSQSKSIDDAMYASSYADDTEANGSFVADQYLPSSLKFNKNSMSIYVKNTTKNRSNRATESNSNSTHFAGAGVDNNMDCENIVCSPNFDQVPFMNNDDDEDDDEDESDLDGATVTPAMAMQAQSTHCLKYMLTKNDAQTHRRGHTASATSMHAYDTNQDNHVPQLIPYGRSSHLTQSLNDTEDTKDDDDMLLVPMRNTRAAPKRNRKVYGTVDDLRNINFLKMYQAAAAVAANASKQKKSDNGHAMNSMNPMRSAVVLRNPRGNQPRTYNTDALYSALMDVKSGESIYRWVWPNDISDTF